MLYCLGDAVAETTLETLDPEQPAFGLITMAELKTHAEALGFSETAIAECESGDNSFRGSVDIHDGYCFSVLNLLNFPDVLGARDRIGFFFARNLLLLVDIVDEDGSTTRLFSAAACKVRPGMSMEKVIYLVLDRILSSDRTQIDAIRSEIARMEEELDDPADHHSFNRRLLAVRRRLLVLYNYYEQLADFGEELQENLCDCFEDENLRYFKLFSDKATRLADSVRLLSESAAQLREAYTSAMDLSVNNLMKIFTIVSTIFLPLTLIVGWYGMNFTTMPELRWRWGYVCVIALSVVVVIACLWYFRRKKYL